MKELRRAAQLLAQASSVALVIHQNPDGDAIGSAVGLYHTLAQKNKWIVCVSDIPAIFQSALGNIKVSQTINDADLVVIIDCAESHRAGSGLGKLIRKSEQPIIVFDHHQLSDLSKIATVYCHNATASSTAEIIFELLDEMRMPISPQIANALLLGIYTDTGGFQFANTTSKTLKTVSRLVRFGGDINRLSQTFTPRRSLTQTKLWGHAFAHIKVNRCGIVTAKISQAVFSQIGATPNDVLGLANALANLEEARAALVLFETPEGWHAKLRTRHHSIDLSRLAYYFGGKGQKKSAGFMATNQLISGKIEDVH